MRVVVLLWALLALVLPATSAQVSLSPATKTIGAGALSYEIFVDTGSEWTATANQTWVTVTPNPGRGQIIASVSVEKNSTSLTRNALITIGTATQQLTQLGADAAGYDWVTTGWNNEGQLGFANVTRNRLASHFAGVSSVSAGGRHTVFVKSDGTLWATGDNSYGQLGDGSFISRRTPVQIASGVVAASAGYFHTAFVKTDGTLWTVGRNNSGELGQPSTTLARSTPVQIASGVASVSTGAGHTMFLKTDGTLWAMGANFSGQLGDGTTTNRATPVQVASGIASVSAGGSHTLFVKLDGTLWAVGKNDYGQIGDGTATSRSTPVQIASGVSSVSAGLDHTLFVKTDGTLWGTGANGFGQLGDGTTTRRFVPVQIATNVASASAGGDLESLFAHSLFIKTNGSVWAMGCNADGRLGDGSTNTRVTPVQIGTGAIIVSTGNNHSASLKADGTLWMCGSNFYGQLGEAFYDRRLTPAHTLPGIVAVSAGGLSFNSSTSMAIRADGTLWATGANASGQLGNGSTASRSQPVQVATGVASVSAGGSHTLFVKTDGSLWGTGDNSSGQLGNGTTANRYTPAQVATGVASVSAGGSHTLFVKTDGSLWAMGSNLSGQLGDGTTANRSTPVQIATEVASVSAGGRHTLFVKTDGTLWAMGANTRGQLGDGSTSNRSAPVQIATGVHSVSAGEEHTHFVKADGSLWAMGYNTNGRLGNGSTTNRSSPVQIATDVASVSAGSSHTFFVKTDGSLWAVGYNFYGQLGDGSNIDRLSPVQVASGIVSVEAGYQHTAILAGPDAQIGPPPLVAPSITTQPVARVVAAGQSATFSVVATGSAPLSYQWLKGGTPLSGQTSATLTLPNVSANDVSLYSVRITNDQGSIESNAVSLTLGTLPVITAQPVALTVTAGQSASFAVTATGTSPLTYEWRRNGTALGVSSSSSLVLANAQAANAGSYSVRVINAVGEVISADASLTVVPSAPIITSAPNSRTVAVGQSTTFTVNHLGSSPLTYQWYRDGVAIEGATGSSYTLASPQAGDAGVYTVTLTNDLGSVTTLPATLSFATPPPNDNFADAELMVGASTTASGTTVGASGESGEPTHFNANGTASSIWYRWTAPADGSITIDTVGSSIDTVLAVYTGSTLTNLNRLGVNDDAVGSASRLVLSVQSGTTYTIAVGGYASSSRGAITLRIVLNGAPVLTSDNLPAGTYDTPYVGYTISATDSPTSYSATGLPPGLTLNPTNGQITGTPTAAGTYTVSLGATNSVGTGYRHSVLHVAKAPATITLSQLLAAHDGTAKPVTATTIPTGLNVVLTYGGQTSAPSAIGGYQVVATVDDPNYSGTATGQLLIVAGVTPTAHDYSTLAGTAGDFGSTDGSGAAARFSSPRGVAVDHEGNLYVADSSSHVIRKVTASGVVTTLAGTPGVSGSIDGNGSEALFFGPVGLTVDSEGNVYVSELLNNTIRKITPAGVVTTLAGTAGQSGATNGSGAEARFNAPNGLVFGPSGDLFVADTGNNVIRKVSPSGAVTTYAGQAGQYGHSDGPAATALFHAPYGLAVDVAGNLYVVETGTHIVRRISPLGEVSTLAGEPGSPGSANGSGSAARFREPTGLTIDPAGTLFVTDSGNHTIRAVTLAGNVSTVGGLAGEPGSSDGVGSAARFNTPYGVALARSGYLYVADMGNHTVRVSSVLGATSSPIITSATAVGGVFNQPFESYLIRAIGFPTSFGATNLPSGLVLDAATGVIAGTPTAGGTYSATISATNASGTGSSPIVFVIAKGNASVTLGATEFAFDGQAKPVSATTVPANLAVNVTYNGNSTAPAAVGTYTVAATINDTNYQGQATGTLTITRASASVTLSGLSATYNGSAQTVTAATAPAGLPVIITYDGAETAPTLPGTYAVEAIVDHPSYEGSATGTLTISKASAVVVLNNLTATYNTTGQSVGVTTAPTNLAVTVTYNGASGLPINAGSYSVVATVDDALYAGTVSGTFVINGAPATVTLGGLGTTYNAQPQAASATTTPAGLSVSFTYDGNATAPTNAGSYTVVGTIQDQNYAGSATGTLVINKATPQLTWAEPEAIVYGTALSSAQLNATANIAGTFTYDPAAGTVLNAGTHALTAVFAPTDQANYVGVSTQRDLVVNKAPATVTLSDLTTTYDGTFKRASFTTAPGNLNVTLTYEGITTPPIGAGTWAVVATIDEPNYFGSATGTLVIHKATPQLTWEQPQAIVYGTALSSAQLNATANVNGTFTYDPAAGAVLNAGTHTLAASFTPTDQANYTGASAQRDLTVNKAPATVTLGNLTTTYNAAAQPVSATTAPANVNVSITYDGSATAPTNAGSYAVVATVDEPNYIGSATGTLVIEKASQSITFALPASIAFSAATVPLQATASSFLPVSFSVVSGLGSITGDELSLQGSGSVTVRASQLGDSNFLATSLERTMVVTGNFLAWQFVHFTAEERANPAISGPEADPDGDGLTNLLEYALGFDPRAANSSGMPTVATTESDWMFTFTRPAERPDIVYAVEFSSALAGWTDAGVTLERVATDGDTETWRARLPLSENPKAFFRLKVSR